MTYDKDSISFAPRPTNPCFINLTQRVFDRLTVLGYAGKVRRSHRWWCKCDCGKITRVLGGHLKNGHTTSCGCKVTQIRKVGAKTNLPHSVVLRSRWNGILVRCHSPAASRKEIRNYQRRGIVVCQGWRLSFHDFVLDMGEPPTLKHTIDRIQRKGNYSCGHCTECLDNGWPFNCRWATYIEQNNNKSDNVFLTHNGETHTVAEWSRKTGLPWARIRQRVLMGWSHTDALIRPIRKNQYR